MSKTSDVELKTRFVFMAPVVLAPPNYGDEIPEALRSKLIESRLECVVSGDFDKGMTSIADMVIHLWSASLRYPLPEEYVRIYAYYTDKLLNGLLRKSGVVVEELTEREEELARELRRKILKRQLRELTL